MKSKKSRIVSLIKESAVVGGLIETEKAQLAKVEGAARSVSCREPVEEEPQRYSFMLDRSGVRQKC